MRSLTPDARYERRTEVVRLRKTGLTYLEIGVRTGVSRTGVFDICKRYSATGLASLRDAPASRASGAVRKLQLPQEALLRQLICRNTPDQLGLPYPLWTRSAVVRLIDARLGLRLKVRTLGSYLARWGFAPRKTGRHVRDLSPAKRLWLHEQFTPVAARAVIEDAEINWGDDAPLGGHVEPGAPLELTSAVNDKGQMRWKVHVGVLRPGDLIEFLRRLVKLSSKKVFLMLHDIPARKSPSVQVWLVEHVDEIEVFGRLAKGARRVDARIEPVA